MHPLCVERSNPVENEWICDSDHKKPSPSSHRVRRHSSGNSTVFSSPSSSSSLESQVSTASLSNDWRNRSTSSSLRQSPPSSAPLSRSPPPRNARKPLSRRSHSVTSTTCTSLSSLMDNWHLPPEKTATPTLKLRRSKSETTRPRSKQRPSCGDKRDYYFKHIPIHLRQQLQMDEVASFSITANDMAEKISELIVSLFPSLSRSITLPSGQVRYPLRITDATACVGGNVLSFADYFEHVTAIECDPIRMTMLQHNLEVLKREENVTCHCTSYLEVMHTLDQEIVFIDPPWGGPDYKDKINLDLYLDEISIGNICQQLQKTVQVIILKVPMNFYIEKLKQSIPKCDITVRTDFHKMYIIICDFRPKINEMGNINKDIKKLTI